jgi:pilus assembly protein CpaE
MVRSGSLELAGVRLRSLIRDKLDPKGPSLLGPDQIEKMLPPYQPELVIVLLSPDPDQGLLALQTIRRVSSTKVVAVGQASEPKLILRALQDGADHYIDEANLEPDFDAVIARFQQQEEPLTPTGKLVAVLAATGGSGASTIAVNVATVMAGDHARSALLDLKPGRGDLAPLLDLKPYYTLADICLNTARLDQGMFEKVLIATPQGVNLIGAPQQYGDLRVITTQGVSQAIQMARASFGHVVADMEDCFHEEQVVALRQASSILLVTRLDFCSLRHVRRMVAHMQELEIPRENIRLVANRFGQPGELAASEAESALDMKFAFTVPDDPKSVNTANNMGVPVVTKFPTAKVALALMQVARDTTERRKRSWTNGFPLARH